MYQTAPDQAFPAMIFPRVYPLNNVVFSPALEIRQNLCASGILLIDILCYAETIVFCG